MKRVEERASAALKKEYDQTDLRLDQISESNFDDEEYDVEEVEIEDVVQDSRPSGRAVEEKAWKERLCYFSDDVDMRYITTALH